MKRQRYIIAAAGAAMSLMLAWAWSCIILFLPLNPDAGYYLSCAERICEGWKPYRDFYVAYPPVGLYYFAFFRGLFGEGYTVYRIALLCAEVLSAFLLFLLSSFVIKNRSLRLTGSLFFLILYLAYDGSAFDLECFVIIFSLLTILLLRKHTRSRIFPFLAGISFLLTIMSKQYGVVIAPAVAFLVFRKDDGLPVDRPSASIRSVLFLAGLFLSSAAILIYFEVSLPEFLSQLSGAGYARWGIGSMLGGIIAPRNVWFAIVLLMSVFTLAKRFRPDVFVVVLLLALNFFPTYVRVYPHYYQLVLPYGIILLMAIAEHYYLDGDGAGKNMFEKTALLSLGLSLIPVLLFALHVPVYYGTGEKLRNYLYEHVYSRYNFSRATMTETLEAARKINEIIPPGSGAAVLNEPSYWYLCNFRPPTREQGYSFIDRKNIAEYDFNRIENIVWFDSKGVDYATFIRHVSGGHARIRSFFLPGGERVEVWIRK